MPIELFRVEKLILNTLAKGPADYWTLLAQSGAQYGIFLNALKKLLDARYVAHGDTLYTLTKEGETIAKAWRLDKKILIDADKRSLLEELAKARPVPRNTLNQLAPLDVVFHRMDIMHRNGDLFGSRIILLGDDDCLGVALAMTEMPAEVIVLENDQGLCNLYRKTHIPKLNVQNYDLFDPLPSNYLHKCDIFFTDPCPSHEILKISLSRGLETLRGRGCAGYTVLSQTEASQVKWQYVEKMLIDAGCTITELIRDVNTYDLEGDWLLQTGWNVVESAPFPPPPPKTHWYRSSLMRFEAIRSPTVIVKGGLARKKELFKDPEVILSKQEAEALR